MNSASNVVQRSTVGSVRSVVGSVGSVVGSVGSVDSVVDDKHLLCCNQSAAVLILCGNVCAAAVY